MSFISPAIKIPQNENNIILSLSLTFCYSLPFNNKVFWFKKQQAKKKFLTSSQGFRGFLFAPVVMLQFWYWVISLENMFYNLNHSKSLYSFIYFMIIIFYPRRYLSMAQINIHTNIPGHNNIYLGTRFINNAFMECLLWEKSIKKEFISIII